MSSEKRKWRGRTGGGQAGQRGLLLLFRYCDIRVGYFILAFVVPFYMLFAHRGYSAIMHYFRLRMGYGRIKSLAMTYRNHYLFGQMLMDRFSFYSGRRSRFKVEIEGNEQFLSLINSDNGVVIAGSHVGNFEIAGYLMHQSKKRMNGIIFGGESALLKAKRSEVLGGNNVNLIPVSDDMSHLFAIKAALDNGEAVNMPCDRIFGSTKSVECELLGAKADFPIGAFLLAAQLNKPMVALFVMKERGMRYRIFVRPIEVDRQNLKGSKNIAEALAQCYVRELDKIVRRYPTQWFNFYDFWK